MNHVIESAETKTTAAKLLSGVTATSRRVWTGVLTSCAILASVAAPGCIVVDDDPDYYDPNEEVIIVDDDPVIESVPIDAGSGLSADPGEGAGVFVEFLGDGQWNVWLTCDTELTGRSCAYDIYATANGIIATGEDLIVSPRTICPKNWVITRLEPSLKVCMLSKPGPIQLKGLNKV